MATIPTAEQATSVNRFEGLDAEQLIRAFRLMHLSRRLDDREIALKRQNRIYFQISGAGHEAIQVAAGMALRAGRRLVLPLLPRPRAVPHARRDAARDAAAGRGRGGRSGVGRPPDAFALGTPAMQHRQRLVAHRDAVRAGGRLRRSRRAIAIRESDEVTLVTAGDGATSEGEFWESLNAACLKRLPLLFLIEDNGYAISVPVECQTAGGNVSALVAGFPGLFRQEVDGTDFLASYRAMKAAAAYCRAGQRPGAGARARHPAVFAFALRRRAAVQDRRGARGRRRARPGAAFPEVPGGRRHARPPHAAAASRTRSTRRCTRRRSRRCATSRPRPRRRWCTSIRRRSIRLRRNSNRSRASAASR